MADNLFILPKVHTQSREINQIQQNVEQAINKALVATAPTGQPVTSITASKSILASDGSQTLLYDATEGAINVSLPPTAVFKGFTLVLMKTDNTFSRVTFNAVGNDSFLGGTTSTTLSTWQERIVLISNGNQWVVLDRSYYQGRQSFTPITNFTNATHTGVYWREGTCLAVSAYLAFTGAPAGATFSITLPSTLAVDTSQLSDTQSGATAGQVYGDGLGLRVGVTEYPQFQVRYDPSGAATFSVIYLLGAGATSPTGAGGITNTLPFAWASGDKLWFNYKIPIVGWAG